MPDRAFEKGKLAKRSKKLHKVSAYQNERYLGKFLR